MSQNTNEETGVFKLEETIESESSGDEIVLSLDNSDEPTVQFIEQITVRRVSG